ncbi:hypothetical protein HN011_010754 [Eciton burchellii]|nr:hypothetical protein HN011_010754 [Eciton burchellii]
MATLHLPLPLLVTVINEITRPFIRKIRANYFSCQLLVAPARAFASGSVQFRAHPASSYSRAAAAAAARWTMCIHSLEHCEPRLAWTVVSKETVQVPSLSSQAPF